MSEQKNINNNRASNRSLPKNILQLNDGTWYDISGLAQQISTDYGDMQNAVASLKAGLQQLSELAAKSNTINQKEYDESMHHLESFLDSMGACKIISDLKIVR